MARAREYQVEGSLLGFDRSQMWRNIVIVRVPRVPGTIRRLRALGLVLALLWILFAISFLYWEVLYGNVGLVLLEERQAGASGIQLLVLEIRGVVEWVSSIWKGIEPTALPFVFVRFVTTPESLLYAIVIGILPKSLALVAYGVATTIIAIGFLFWLRFIVLLIRVPTVIKGR